MAQARWLVAGSAVALLCVGALIGLRNHRAVPAPPIASASASVPASASAPASGPLSSANAPQARSVVEFSFDCAGLPPVQEACSGASPLAAKLVDSAVWAKAGMALCANALTGGRADAAARALRDAQVLTQEKLPPLERALLQNAALRLLTCSANVETDAMRKEIAQNARRLVKAFALDATEIAALPSSAGELSWLGEGSGWQVGTLRTHLHESADGYVSTIERAKHEDEFASIYRLILVDDKGEPHATDVVSKLLLRRPAEAGRFSACIATLDPKSAHCNSASLRPAAAELQREALTPGSGMPTCNLCHVLNHANSPSFGPSVGLGPDTVTLDRERESLTKVLAP
jgi:hypothetical protein